MIFDHIGLFVRDIELGQRQLAAVLPILRWTDVVDDALMKVRVRFGYDGSGICYELVAPLGDPNPVAKALDEGKNILNHVAYRCADFVAACAALRREGAVPLGRPQPAAAFDGARVAFYLTPLRFIVELVEDRAGAAPSRRAATP